MVKRPYWICIREQTWKNYIKIYVTHYTTPHTTTYNDWERAKLLSSIWFVNKIVSFIIERFERKFTIFISLMLNNIITAPNP